MNLNEAVQVPAGVMSRVVGDETVILDLETGTYFGLDPVGARMWALMSQGKSLSDVVETLLTEFDVTRETVRQDLIQLVATLKEHKLLVA